MGNARARGTYEQRKAAAIKAGRTTEARQDARYAALKRTRPRQTAIMPAAVLMAMAFGLAPGQR